MNKKLILIFIVVSLFLTGCGVRPTDDRPITDVDVRKGIEGLNMKFVRNAPPDRVFEHDVFPMAVELKNEGAFDIGDDENTQDIEEQEGIVVFGFEKTYVDISGGDEKCTGEVCKVEIEGKSVFNPAGDDEFITINAQAKKIGEQSETHRSTILATACYPYKTVFGSSVCIDTDVYGIVKRQKACSVQDLVFDGQGAPVAVTKIETRMLPQDNDEVKPHFIIYIENKGNGEVIDKSKLDTACSSKALKYTDFNVIKISASLSGKPLVCSVDKEGMIRLREKEDMIRCESKEEDDIPKNRDAYTSPLKIELDYGYTFTISKNIIIEKILTH
jgi:hypothetical protein